MEKIRSYIKGVGHYVPERVVTNHELSTLMDTSDEWIIERTGIKERRYADENVGPSDLAIPAVEDALSDAKTTKEEIDLIIFATISSDYYIPGSGCLLQDKMGFPNIGAFDIKTSCAGFVYGLSMADQYIKSGTFDNILIVCSEVQSTTMDLSDKGRDTAVIFGDGAGAVVLSSTTEDRGVLSTHLHSDGKFAKELWLKEPSTKSSERLSKESIDRGDHFLSMNGREVFRHAVRRFPEAINESLNFNGLTADDIDLLIPHQANLRISDMIQKKMGLPDSKVFNNIQKYGNTTAASIPICLSEAKKQGRINSDDLVVCAAFGAGFLWGSAIIKW
jgi:3-oxoacyl-[acyl-carrier-protein] synthase-3